VRTAEFEEDAGEKRSLKKTRGERRISSEKLFHSGVLDLRNHISRAEGCEKMELGGERWEFREYEDLITKEA